MIKNSQDTHDINFPYSVKKPPFPPQLTVEELMTNALEKLRKNKISKTPNAFLAYRMAFQKQFYNTKSHPTMRDLSLMATKFWLQEPEYIKARYYQLMKEAKTQFEKICNQNFPLQFVEYRPCIDLSSSQPLRTSTYNPNQNFWSSELSTTTKINMINPISPIIDSQQQKTVEQGSPIVSQQLNSIVQLEDIEKNNNSLNSDQNPSVDIEVLTKRAAELEDQDITMNIDHASSKFFQ
ncbi:943_t:CDS:2 [Ambispora leptoticha]|uniref:943_t:CDS:1 n=1 Tax=Ambispora leptoticha TaxID=144679 RepID=A0A9N9FHB0_9GLOM|nr:943_t:CDS:2 [Ambispora leptoticha]